MNSRPTSLAMAVIVAGSAASESAGTAAKPAGGDTQSSAQSVASVAEPPLPKSNSRPPARNSSHNGRNGVGDYRRLFGGYTLAKGLRIGRLLCDRGYNARGQVFPRRLLAA